MAVARVGALVLLLPLAIGLWAPCASPVRTRAGLRASDGAGGAAAAEGWSVAFDANLRVLDRKGGGVMSLVVDGAAAREMRRRVDLNRTPGYIHELHLLGNNDSMVQPKEVEGFKEFLEDLLEEDIRYLFGVQLGHRDTNVTRVSGMAGTPTDSSAAIRLEMDFRGSFRDKQEINLSLDRLMERLFAVPEHRSRYDLALSVLYIGAGSLTLAGNAAGTFDQSEGATLHLRFPGGEYLSIRRSLRPGDGPIVGFHRVDPIGGSAAMSVVVGILCVLMVYLPRSQSQSWVRRVGLIHWSGYAAAIVCALIYALGLYHMVVYATASALATAVALASHLVYRRGLWIRAHLTAKERGIQSLMEGNYLEAIKALMATIESAPSDPEPWNDLGVVLKTLNRTEEAISCYNRALAFDPDYSDALFNKAVALRHRGRYAEAKSCYEAILRIHPGDPEAKVGLEYCANRLAGRTVISPTAAGAPSSRDRLSQVGARVRTE